MCELYTEHSRQGLKIQRLWQSEKHSGFTDIIRYKHVWYCVFREGSTHMSLDGAIIVLTSKDCKEWQEHSRLTWQGGDLRDPKLSITPDNLLILSAGIRWAIPSSTASKLYSVAWPFDKDLQSWSPPIMDSTSEGTWRWSITWHNRYAYSVGYSGLDKHGCLYRSIDGLYWKPLVKPFFPETQVFTNESTLVSDGDRLVCLCRRDAIGGAKSILGQSDNDNQIWSWCKLPIAIGGPKLLKLSNNEWVMAVRHIKYKYKTANTRLYKLNPENGHVKLWHTLPSSGDCSYAGLVEHEGNLYISYYSSHQNKQTNVYLAVIPLINKKRSKRYS